MKDFKYQITVEDLLSKHKEKNKICFCFNFNFTTKTVSYSEYFLDKSFQQILCRIDDLINETSGWVIESVDAEYMNVSIFSPLSGSTYIELPRSLKNSVKSLINIKNNNNKCFLWCHIRHLNLSEIHPERIKKADKNMVNHHDYEGIKFPVSEKDFDKTENNLVYPVYVSDQKIEDCMDLLMVVMKTSHTMSTSMISTDLCAIRQSAKIKTLLQILFTML